jgi:hypothetical protein
MAALVEALERHVGEAAARNRRAPFALNDAGELRELVGAAGFDSIAVSTIVGHGRFPSPEEFVAAQLAATPLSTLGAISEQARAAVAGAVRAALRGYIDSDGLAFPMEAHLVLAHTR